MDLPEKRIFAAGAVLGFCGAAAASLWLGPAAGASFLLGAALSAINLAWLRAGIGRLMLADRSTSQRRVLMAFIARLLLIPLVLCAMLRFLFFSLPAAVAGFAVFHCGVLFEGILEACRARSGKNARA